jgi:hypothetical protein
LTRSGGLSDENLKRVGKETFEKWGGKGHLQKFQDAMRGLIKQYRSAQQISNSSERMEAQNYVRDMYSQSLARAETQSGLTSEELLTSTTTASDLPAELPAPMLQLGIPEIIEGPEVIPLR